MERSLTIGPPCGRIQELVAKVSAINAKHGPFDALFVLGDFFKPWSGGDEDLSEDERLLLAGDIRCEWN